MEYDKPKLHHYVPQFYLKRFANANGKLWVWDKLKDAIFQTNPKNVAAENNFYWMQELADAGHDPNALEKQLSVLETNASLITDQWLYWFSDLDLGRQIDIPDANREEVALFVAVQWLRTLDQREIISALGNIDPTDLKERARRHTNVMWDFGIISDIRDRIKNSVWIFGRNETAEPFITSDNPVAFKTPDNRQWTRSGILLPGVYAVYPLSPEIVMYCYDPVGRWAEISKFANSLSPVRFTQELVDSDNCGQVFMATRFVFSSINKFDGAKDFADAITTNRYGPQ
jgi:hypothetical protein